jgi:hypothetical protein
MGKRGPQPGPEKIRRLIGFEQVIWDWLDEKAAKRGDKSAMVYLMRNVEEQYEEAMKKAKGKKK